MFLSDFFPLLFFCLAKGWDYLYHFLDVTVTTTIIVIILELCVALCIHISSKQSMYIRITFSQHFSVDGAGYLRKEFHTMKSKDSFDIRGGRFQPKSLVNSRLHGALFKCECNIVHLKQGRRKIGLWVEISPLLVLLTVVQRMLCLYHLENTLSEELVPALLHNSATCWEVSVEDKSTLHGVKPSTQAPQQHAHRADVLASTYRANVALWTCLPNITQSSGHSKVKNNYQTMTKSMSFVTIEKAI